MPSDPFLDSISEALQAFLQDATGGPARVDKLEVMADGHAGLTYGFELDRPGRAAEAFILKRGPPGVPRRGSTDVHRQAPLLRALSAAGFPAPELPWACETDTPLGSPFVVMRRLPGRTFIVWDPSPALLAAPQRLPLLWVQTAHAMGQLHCFPMRERIGDWEEPTTLTAELDRWSALLRHMRDPFWRELAEPLRDRLHHHAPTSPLIGLVHGDFQPGNVLFDDHRLTGVIDWDLAAIAPQGIDVGWLLMMADRDSWAEGWKPCRPPPRSQLLEAYWDAGGPVREDLAWFQAFAHFRFGAIAGLNLKLHRDGRRPDAIWEAFAPSIPILLRRGLDFLGDG